MSSPASKHLPTKMRNANFGPAFRGVLLSREASSAWECRVHGCRIEDSEFPFLALVSTPIVRATKRELLPSVGVLVQQKSLFFGSPCDESWRIS